MHSFHFYRDDELATKARHFAYQVMDKHPKIYFKGSCYLFLKLKELIFYQLCRSLIRALRQILEHILRAIFYRI
jgi:hypothetical protein